MVSGPKDGAEQGSCVRAVNIVDIVSAVRGWRDKDRASGAGHQLGITVEQIEALYTQGLGTAEIAAHLGCTVQTVTYHRRRIGKPKHKGAPPHPRREESLALLRQGVKPREVADRLGIEISTVWNHKAMLRGEKK